MSAGLHAAAASLARAFRLRRCDAVGPDAVLDGAPFVRNAGTLEIGARLRLASRPVQSHLVVGRGATLEIGDDVSIGHGAAIAASARVRIGSGASIGPYVCILDTDYHVAQRRDAAAEPSPIDIGDRVRIGARVTILRGAVVGDGARIDAGSVVAGEVPRGAHVLGVPARPVATRGAAAIEDEPASVAAVVGDALSLGAPPADDAVLATFERWDSLGALGVLVALEEAFAVSLDDAAVYRASTVHDLAQAVEAARARRAAG